MAVKYEAVGSGIEDMPTAQNYETTSIRDVLGQSRTRATRGNKVITVSPLAINRDYEFSKFVDLAIERQFELSQLEKEFLFVKMYKKVGESELTSLPVAWKQKGIVVPTDWATGNQELQAGVEVNLIGEATFGTVDFDALTGEKFMPETHVPTTDEIFYEEGDASRSDFVMYYIHETV